MKSPILGSSYVARSVNAADNRMVNLFPEAIPEGGKEAAFLQRAPGLRLLATAGNGPIRGLWQVKDYLYVASGNSLYKVSKSWAATRIGDITGTGSVSMSDNGTQLFVACNPDGYIYNTNTQEFKQITDPDYPGAVTVGYLDGYFVFNEPDSQKFWVTSLLDGSSVDPLDFASAEGSPDNLVSLIVDHREVWLFGINSVEVWYNAGTLDFPLQRIQGAYNEIGCAAPYSVAKLDNAIFWLGQDARGQGIVYRSNGYTATRVSTHAIEWQLQQYANMSDAIGYTYQQDGHAFYVLVFPQADTTWVFDVAAGAWHERARWNVDKFSRHRGNCQAAFNSEIVIGDFENGNLYAFDLDTYSDNGAPQRWLRSWRALPTGTNNLKRTAHHTLQLDCEVGIRNTPNLQLVAYTLTTEAGDQLITENDVNLVALLSEVADSKTQLMLRWSDDGGHTWSNEHWASMGELGQYGIRVIWRRLGMSMKLRDRVYEVSGTDPAKIIILGAELRMSPTNA